MSNAIALSRKLAATSLFFTIFVEKWIRLINSDRFTTPKSSIILTHIAWLIISFFISHSKKKYNFISLMMWSTYAASEMPFIFHCKQWWGVKLKKFKNDLKRSSLFRFFSITTAAALYSSFRWWGCQSTSKKIKIKRKHNQRPLIVRNRRILLLNTKEMKKVRNCGFLIDYWNNLKTMRERCDRAQVELRLFMTAMMRRDHSRHELW